MSDLAAALVAGRQSPQQQVSLPPLVVDVVAISKAPVAFRVNAQGSVTPKVTTVLVHSFFTR